MFEPLFFSDGNDGPPDKGQCGNMADDNPSLSRLAQLRDEEMEEEDEEEGQRLLQSPSNPQVSVRKWIRGWEKKSRVGIEQWKQIQIFSNYNINM